MHGGVLYRLSAFTTDPSGGNPAGVWVGASLPAPEAMQQIASDVGYSETAFIAPTSGTKRVIRYYSPEAEVPFCGHATIATGVLLGDTDGDGDYKLEAVVGEIPVSVKTRQGIREASLTSVAPAQGNATEALIAEALLCLQWQRSDLDPSIPPGRAYAGAWHLVLAVSQADRLSRLTYDFEGLKALMLREELTTLQLVWRENQDVFHSRNPFPVGGVVEDPATGAAAAALGGYLRSLELVEAPCTVLVRQGEAMDRPSRIVVDIPSSGGIVVSGAAVRL